MSDPLTLVFQGLTAAGAMVAAAATVRIVLDGRRRRQSREALGLVVDSGNELAEDFRAGARGKVVDQAELEARFLVWLDRAHATVMDVDRAQIGKYQAPLPIPSTRYEEITERLARLQEIQDRL